MKPTAGKTINDHIVAMIERRRRCNQRFKQTFGVSLSRFWDNLTGFDIIKFDEEFVKPEKDQSTADAVKLRYGDEAVSLVRHLISG